MSYTTKLICGILLITFPTILSGGYFILQILSGKQDGLKLNDLIQVWISYEINDLFKLNPARAFPVALQRG